MKLCFRTGMFAALALAGIGLGGCAQQIAAAAGEGAGTTIGTAATVADAAVIAAAKGYCAVEPDLTSIDAVKNATGGVLTALQIGKVLCDGYKAIAAYTAETGAAPLPPRRRTLRKGDKVEGTAVVNGRAIPVTGTYVGPVIKK